VRRRRRVFPIVDARFQLKYTLLIMVLGVGATAIMGGLWYHARLESTRLLALGGDTDLLGEIVRADRRALLFLVAGLLAMALSLAGCGVIVTHRISGPLHLVARYLSLIGQGYLPDVRPLRKRDELQSFFAAFEDAVRTMRVRQRASLRDIDTALALASASLQGKEGVRVGLEQAVETLQEQRTAIANGLAASAAVEEEAAS
jgi:hypothetical protein